MARKIWPGRPRKGGDRLEGSAERSKLKESLIREAAPIYPVSSRQGGTFQAEFRGISLAKGQTLRPPADLIFKIRSYF